MAVKIRYRRDTTANWAASNPVLDAGEVGLDTDLKRIKVGDGTSAWSNLNFLGWAYDFRLGFSGAPAASELSWILVGRSAKILSADPGTGFARTAPAANTTFDIQKNGVSVGSITFSASSQTGTVTLSADVSLSAGDRLEVIAPATPDASLTNVQFHLKGVDR